ncbi:hypothetical protein [Paraglaciecola mesophila]|uniref:hypothetical protein n=1 Tax=Paraglaciecola mesophila TaxID=197222 RepID=UPI0034A3816F
MKLVWFIFGSALTTMSFTGVLMTWKRTRTQALTRAQKITLPIFACSLIAFIFWFSKFS